MREVKEVKEVREVRGVRGVRGVRDECKGAERGVPIVFHYR